MQPVRTCRQHSLLPAAQTPGRQPAGSRHMSGRRLLACVGNSGTHSQTATVATKAAGPQGPSASMVFISSSRKPSGVASAACARPAGSSAAAAATAAVCAAATADEAHRWLRPAKCRREVRAGHVSRLLAQCRDGEEPSGVALAPAAPPPLDAGPPTASFQPAVPRPAGSTHLTDLLPPLWAPAPTRRQLGSQQLAVTSRHAPGSCGPPVALLRLHCRGPPAGWRLAARRWGRTWPTGGGVSKARRPIWKGAAQQRRECVVYCGGV